MHRRSASLREIAAGVRQRREEFARIIASEGIKTIREARLEADRCATTFELSAEECSRLGGETVAFDQVPKGDGRIGWWSRRPLGVVAGLTPYNDPLNLVAHKLGPSDCCRCTDHRQAAPANAVSCFGTLKTGRCN